MSIFCFTVFLTVWSEVGDMFIFCCVVIKLVGVATCHKKGFRLKKNKKQRRTKTKENKKLFHEDFKAIHDLIPGRTRWSRRNPLPQNPSRRHHCCCNQSWRSFPTWCNARTYHWFFSLQKLIWVICLVLLVFLTMWRITQARTSVSLQRRHSSSSWSCWPPCWLCGRARRARCRGCKVWFDWLLNNGGIG